MTQFFDQSRGCWRFKFQIDKVCHCGSKFRTKRAAAKAEAILRKKLIMQDFNPQDTHSKSLVETYIEHAKTEFVRKTCIDKIRVYAKFMNAIGENALLSKITPAIVLNFLRSRPTRNNYNVYRKEISALFEYAIWPLELLVVNPVKRIPKRSHSAKKKIIPYDSTITMLLNATEEHSDDRDLLLVLLYSFARIGEVLRLKWEDVNFEQKVLTKYTRKTKGGTYDPIPIKMNKDLFDIMHARFETKSQNTWVFYNSKTKTCFTNKSRLMPKLCKKIEIPTIGFHTLRHYMASLLSNDPDVSIKTIQSVLGHKSSKTTEIYIHSIDHSISSAMDSLNGKFLTGENHDNEIHI